MELRQVRCFDMVAREGDFGRAALRLEVVEEAVGAQIRLLEGELAAELLDRASRPVRLTAAGERFLPAARALLAAEERAYAAVAEPARPDARTLRLGAGTGLGAHLDRVLDAYAALAPEASVELVAAAAGERLDLVAERGLDAAFVRGTPSGARRDDLRFVPLWQDPLVAVVPSRHSLAASPGTLGLTDLADVPLTLTGRQVNRGLFDLVVGACRAAGFEPVNGPPSGSLEDALAAVGAGGPDHPLWTVVYAAHARRLGTPGVAFLPFRNPGMELTTYLAVPRTDPPPGIDLLLRACAPPDEGR